jgi:hypothetical protein
MLSTLRLKTPRAAIGRILLSLPLLGALAGCDQLGIETPAVTAAKKEAEGRAIGGACRHAMHSIEECYRSYPKSPKAAIFDGWREMDGYMRENNIPGMPAAAEPVAGAASAAHAEAPAAKATNGAAPPTGAIPLIQGLPQRPDIAPKN